LLNKNLSQCPQSQPKDLVVLPQVEEDELTELVEELQLVLRVLREVHADDQVHVLETHTVLRVLEECEHLHDLEFRDVFGVDLTLHERVLVEISVLLDQTSVLVSYNTCRILRSPNGW
jgi:hypothetical protein